MLHAEQTVLLLRQALDSGLELTVLDSPAYRRYAEQRRG